MRFNVKIIWIFTFMVFSQQFIHADITYTPQGVVMMSRVDLENFVAAIKERDLLRSAIIQDEADYAAIRAQITDLNNQIDNERQAREIDRRNAFTLNMILGGTSAVAVVTLVVVWALGGKP